MNSDITYFLVAIMLVFANAFTVRFFLSKIESMQKDLRRLSREIALNKVPHESHPKFKPSLMEGDLDMTFKGHRASVRAIFYPRKIS